MSGEADSAAGPAGPGGNAPPEGQSAGFTSAQLAGLGARRVDQDRTLDAVHRLEEAWGSAAPGREGPWRDAVAHALDVLDDATAEEERNAARPESLLSDIARTQPRLRHRVRGVRAQYGQLRDTIGTLRRELAEPDAHVEFSDLRQRLAWLVAALRHQRARESDLIYEAYYEAFNRDLEDDLRGGP